MTKGHEPAGRPKRVAEPVQVYLDAPDRNRLDRLIAQLHATKSDVLRRALEALEQELSSRGAQPYEQIIALGAEAPSSEEPGYDVAREHDRVLAHAEVDSWTRGRRSAPRRHARTRRGR